MRLLICDEELSLFDLNNNLTVVLLDTLWSVSTYKIFKFKSCTTKVHCWLGLFICVFGSLANYVHIFVLSRPAMQKCAVNRLLAIIALCDIATMASYTVFVVRFEFAVDESNPPKGYDFLWIVFLLAHVVCSIALHTITVYLTVITALIRYKTLKRVGSLWNHENIACPIFLMVAVVTVFLCIPTFLIHSIIPVTSTDSITQRNITLYTVGLAEFEQFDMCLFFKLNLWLTGIIFKVIPCVLLLLFTLALLYELEKNHRKRKLMCSGTTLAYRRHSAQSDRTTKILLILLIVFFCTEFPQGILSIMNGLFPNDIHQFVYLSLGELLDLLSLINCNTCFIVYPLISSQYRATLRNLADCIRQLVAGRGWQAATANIKSRSGMSEAKFAVNSRRFTLSSSTGSPSSKPSLSFFLITSNKCITTLRRTFNQNSTGDSDDIYQQQQEIRFLEGHDLLI
ncbi:Serpentine type 7TM GPCR chemoreceptor Srw [Globodera pallida]|nr:Serpentine type 7TM GPCR chemoreceptor Srw [Globodera pallida]